MQFTDEELAIIGMSLALTGHLIVAGSDAAAEQMVQTSKPNRPVIDLLLAKIDPHLAKRVAHLEGLAELVKNGKPQ